MKKAALLLLAATSASAAFLRADVRTGISPQSATNACSQHNLCGSCLSENACVWCADGAGSCVQGDLSTGPVDTKTCKNWEGSYCSAEPCAQYTSCSTCTSDSFCGWSSTEKVCVEGDKKGPLTGKTEEWRWNVCQDDAAATGGADAGETGSGETKAEAEATSAIKTAEAKIVSEEKKEEGAIKAEKQMLGKEKSKFDIIHKMTALVGAFKSRKAAIGAAEEHDKELFLKAFASMTKERKGDYEDILAAYNRMEKSFARDQAVLKKRDEQLDKFEVANNQEDNTIKSGGNMLSSVNSTSDEKQMVSMVAVLKNADGDKLANSLESFIGKLDSKGKNFLKKVSQAQGRSVNAELHRAALRMEERTEAAGYSCQFLLCHPDTECRDFPTMYSGTMEKKNTDAALSREEQVRVCNSVHNQLDRHPEKPKYAGANCLANEVSQGYLKWCINNVHT